MKTGLSIYFQLRTTFLPQMTQITQMPGEACPGHYMKSCLDRLTKYLRHLRHLRQKLNPSSDFDTWSYGTFFFTADYADYGITQMTQATG